MLVAMGSAAASPWYNDTTANTFAGYAAKALTYFQDVRAQVIGKIAENSTYSYMFVKATASQIYDLQHLKANVLGLLAGADTDGNGLIDFAEFLAQEMMSVQAIKGDVLYQLATTYFTQFTQGLWEEMTYLMKIKSRVVELLATQ